MSPNFMQLAALCDNEVASYPFFGEQHMLSFL